MNSPSQVSDKNLKIVQPLPGDLALWFFIMVELLTFGIFFLVYVVTRTNNVELFNSSQLELHQIAGVINTFILITSSYFVAIGVQSIKKGELHKTGNMLLISLFLGFAFLVVKLWEYSQVFGAGIHMSTNAFYTFYISLTFFHFMHVIMGMVILGSIYYYLKKGKYSQNEHDGVESGASYWHMVDLIWIVLFPLVYVIR